MATFKSQVEGITSLSVGTTPTDDELSQFLVDGTKEVTNRIITVRPDEIGKFTASTNDASDAGIPLTGQVISVVREHDDVSILRDCSSISPGNRYAASDSTSLSYRSKYNPGFYILDGKIHTVPASAGSDNDAIVTQVYYAVNQGHSSSSIDSFPDEYEYLVVLYASLRSINAIMGAKTTPVSVVYLDSPSLSITATAPSALSLSAITYTGISNVDTGAVADVVHTTLSITGATQPAYNGGDIVGLADGTLTVEMIDTALSITDLSITAVTPDMPVVPNFTVSPGLSLPSYTKLITAHDPGVPTDLSAVYDWTQVVTDIGAFPGITAVSPDTPSLTEVTFTGAGADNSTYNIADSSAFVISLGDPGGTAATITGTAPVYIQPAPPDRPDMETSITEQDIEMLSAKAQQYQTDLGAFQAEMGDATSEFNEANVLFQANLQKDMAKAQADNQAVLQSLQKNLTIAQADAQVENTVRAQNKAAELQNAVTDMQEIINDNQRLLATWQQELSQYQAEVNTEVQDYQQKLAKYNQEITKELTVWQQRRQGEISEHGQKISRFQAIVGDELNKFNTDLQAYQAEIQALIQEASYEQQAEYAAQLQQYQAEVGTYGAEVNSEVQEWQANTNKDLQVWQQTNALALQEHSQRMQDALNLFNEESVEYQAEVQAETQQASINQQENMQNMQKALQIAIRDKDRSQEHQLQETIQDTQALIADNQRKIGQYQAELGLYTAQVSKETQEYTSQVQAYSADASSELQKYQAELQAKQAEYQWLQDQYARIKAEYDSAFIALAPPGQGSNAQEQPRA